MNQLKILLFHVIFLDAAIQSHGKRNFEILLDSCTYKVNPLYVKYSSCDIDKTYQPPRANFEVQMQREVFEMRYSVELVILKNNNESFTLLNSTDNDGCMLLEGKGGMTLVKILKDLLLTAGKLPEKCPVDKDFHYLFKDFEPDAERLPPYVPEARFALHVNITERNELIFGFESYGEVKQKTNKRWG